MPSRIVEYVSVGLQLDMRDDEYREYKMTPNFLA